jgi:hypothetical protein
LDYSALYPDHGGVSAIVCTQLGEDVLDSSLHSLFRDVELRRSLFVGIPSGNQPQYIDFPWCQRLIRGVLGNSYDASAESVFFPAKLSGIPTQGGCHETHCGFTTASI